MNSSEFLKVIIVSLIVGELVGLSLLPWEVVGIIITMFGVMLLLELFLIRLQEIYK